MQKFADFVKCMNVEKLQRKKSGERRKAEQDLSNRRL